MVTPAAGNVVLVRFPFSNLSRAKLRPALVLVNVGRNNWILCQITSNPYVGSQAVEITDNDFQSGWLRATNYARLGKMLHGTSSWEQWPQFSATSYARPGKLFTANAELMVAQVGILQDATFRRVIDAILDLFSGRPT